MFKIAKIENPDFLNSCIYTYVNQTRQNLYIKLISIINNF